MASSPDGRQRLQRATGIPENCLR
ncbi:rCG59530 [Rattus norvegicus]|uniref:RCG59530 n=1 Tax=Rattus norvegicus TaxID=10116 RepID=A6HSM7_RAT|nr:rCG59530 [Rattus norvegicus]